MPTYEYECKSCSHNFEVFQSMSELPIENCPECGGEVRRLIFGGTGVIFKGSGFYVTDKSKPAAKKEKAACADCPAKSDTCPAETAKSSSTETKPESKSA
jgi:putative FmdB family regulatory protein